MSWISYSQNGEDVMLLRALRHVEKGFYIDVGANDPFEDSVTQALYERGWHGINVEPVPRHYNALVEQRPSDINLQCAAGETDGSFTLYEIEEIRGWATLDASMAKAYSGKGYRVLEIPVSVTTLSEICSQYVDGEIHFLKVDVEGAEEQVFRGMDFNRWRPWIIIAESRVPTADGPVTAAWEHLLLNQQYSSVYFDGINTFYLADERREELRKSFEAPPNVLDDYIRYSEWLQRQESRCREALLKETDQYSRTLEEALQKAQEQLADIEHLKHTLASTEQTLASTEQTLASLYASRSWKITAPLRSAGIRLRRLKTAAVQHIDISPEAATVSTVTLTPPLRGALHGDALELYDILTERAVSAEPSQARSERLSLAFVSPLPPVKSGIADYSAALLPLLSKHYDITIVTDQADPAADSVLPVRNADWLMQNGDSFDRILYHIGNSPYHSYMFRLLKRHPGTVMLHDVFLSDLVNYLGNSAGDKDALAKTVYREQGFTPLSGFATGGISHLLASCPCTLHLLKDASGVLVHSEFARNVLAKSYGPSVEPLLRIVPFMRNMISLPERSAARGRLGIGEEEFLVCSFGFIGYTKLSHRLVAAWQGSMLERSQRSRLCFVGDNDKGVYGVDLLKAIEQSGNSSQITVTGFTPPETYLDYLAAADLAVQLRENTRGETSAAVYDCLAAGLPLICNAHGSNADLPDDCVYKISDRFEESHLRHAIESFFREPEQGRELAVRGRQRLAEHNRPEQGAESYYQALEHFAGIAPRSHERARLLSFPAAATLEERSAFATSLAADRPPCGLRQLLIDISAIVQHDLKTGIQRVVRSILNELLASPPAGYRVEPVYSNGNGGYRYARKFLLKTSGLEESLLDDAPVQPAEGDIFIGADLVFSIIPSVEQQLRRWRAQGVQISFIVYDLLPIQRPDCFPAAVEGDFCRWLATVASVADHLVCISRAVADELREYLGQNTVPANPSLQVGHFHLGADIGASLPTTGMPADIDQLLQKISAYPAFLIVGTIEPRKGHAQTLNAFELLWQEGIDTNLVIVGKPGWMTEKLIERLDTHPEQGKRLFCLYGISDEMLELVYKNCACLLAPSIGEGFGLPLIEAAQHGLPLIVRDIPVFREVAGEHATYFNGSMPTDLAIVIKNWLLLPEEEKPSSSNMPWLTWKQSVQQLLTVLSCETAEQRAGFTPAIPDR